MAAGPLPSAVAASSEPVHARRYRADIDGLRAVSILLVVAFHARVPGFDGGFVGVDVFFVISGFLITGLLMAEYERSGSLDLGRFIARRARRLLPLAGTVVVATLTVGYLLVAPLDRLRLAWDAVVSTLYVANWRYATQSTAYSDIEVTDSLLLHYWSLSIEEQFYLFWPILLLGAGWLARRRSWTMRRVLFGASAVIVVTSFASSVLLTQRLGPAAYYVTHTRLWELAAGAMLAILAARVRRVPARFAEAAGVVGLTMIGVGAVTYDASTPFPGWAATLPVLGAALVIASAVTHTTLVARVLAAGSLPRLGRWSYAWYLWHWPVIGLSLLAQERFGWQVARPLVVAAAVVGSLGLAAITHVAIEQPLRRSHGAGDQRRRVMAVAVLAVTPVLVAVAVLSFGSTGDRPITETPAALGQPQDRGETAAGDRNDAPFEEPSAITRPEVTAMSPQEAMEDRVSLGNPGCNAGGHENTEVPPDCVFGDPTGDAVLALIGDSHAQHWLPAFDAVARGRGWRLLSWTKGACAPFELTIYDYRRERPYDGCDAWRDNLMDRLVEEEPDVVVVGRSYGYQGLILDEDEVIVTEPAELADRWSLAVGRTLARLDGHAEHVVILHDTPWADGPIPRCLSQAEDPSDCSLDVQLAAGRDEPLLRAEADAGHGRSPDLSFIDMNGHICPEDPCSMVLPNGVIKYRDNSHLSQTYSRWLAPELDAAMEAALGEDLGR